MKTPPTKSALTTNTARPGKVPQHAAKAHAIVEGTETVRLNVEMPKSLHQSVKMRALQEGRTIKEVVLSLMADYAE